ncbi:hypothetical protein GGQ22_02795 [Nocardioides sp. zg-579]|uniref:Delta-60 repeat domain-containing protein n=1 Tax=Nocardioides marmotae TaxID=2663857 RepID=A0A6I3IZ69_9ACTN|nr:hypothetical protein [Nocardioides marmotae]MCR6030367.1 hypothetical protein [Gordonia jinghuaiqii]MTB94001.1 hypothetical protein [Nocardioides marmotae]QKE00316.1 hypothetical protein HPC71_03875 [Nocardioides marmotae]
MRRGILAAAAALSLGCGLLGASQLATADVPGGTVVRTTPVAGTPHILDGRVFAVTRVGDTVILGGSFTRVRNEGSTTEVVRNGLVALDANTGQLRTGFNPNPGTSVTSLLPAGDGTSVYVGGGFTSISGATRARVARIRVADGSVVSTFNAGTVNGNVRDMALRGGRLWIAGAFTHVAGRSQPALATLDPATGAFSPYMGLRVAGTHRGSGVTQVLKIDTTTDGSRLVAVGNFDTLQGVQNHQLLMLDTSGATAQPATFRTGYYLTPCSSAFDTYMRDVAFSGDDSFFVVTTTGAYGGSTGACDTTARFETRTASTDARPSWINHTGGDTTYGVEITPAAVYVGGHQRWQNNPFAGDRAGPGAVAREGIAALDPVNGLPLSWNPGRDKGVGVFDFLVDDRGLWVASDTTRIAGQLRSRIALLLKDGATRPTIRTPLLPNDVYTGASTAAPTGLLRRRYDGAVAGTVQDPPDGGLDWSTVRGAFMVNGWLYLGRSDGSFTRRTFTGSTYGTAQAVDTSDRIVRLAAWHDEIAVMTGMFLDDNRVYFTLAGDPTLYYRYFTPESGVVGAQRYVASTGVSGLDLRQARGMFLAGSQVYVATTTGDLVRVGWERGGPSGRLVPGTAATVSGPVRDGRTWGGRAMFLFQSTSGGGA